jgi:hypothetical protein
VGSDYPSQEYGVGPRLASVEEKVDTTWTDLPGNAGWGTSSAGLAAGGRPLGWCRSLEGRILLRGYVDQGFGNGTAVPIAILPLEARPPFQMVVAVYTAGGAAAYVTITTAGGILWNGAGSGYIDLQPIAYFAKP